MMDIRDYETKRLIELGFKNIKNSFMKEMIAKQNFSISQNGGLCPFTVSFYITPQINATIRVGSQQEKFLLFESLLDFKADELIPSTKRGCKGMFESRVEQAVRNCNNIKNRQTKARDACLDFIENKIEKEKLLNNKILIIKLKPEDGINKNITGLIANQLMGKYQCPILLLNKIHSPEGEVRWEGSGRGYTTEGFEDLRGFLRDSGLVYLAEGHPQACGAGIADSKLNQFIEYSNNELQDIVFEQSYKVDFIWNYNNFKPNDVIEIAELNSLWGQELPQPNIAVERIQVTKDNVFLMSPDKNPTLKIILPNGTNLLKFKSSVEEYESLKTESGSVTINIVGTCEINEWNGKITPQITVKDYEVVGRQEYYF